MDTLRGRVLSVQAYERAARLDWSLSISRLIWFLIWILLPFSLFRFLAAFCGVLYATAGVFVLIVIVRLVGPGNLVMLDELIGRIFPPLRPHSPTGMVQVHEFRIEKESKQHVTCIMTGNLRGSLPLINDFVSMEGVYRQGCFFAFQGVNERTSAAISIDPRRSAWILAGSFGVMIFFVLYLIGYFDEWIYQHLAEAIDTFIDEM